MSTFSGTSIDRRMGKERVPFQTIVELSVSDHRVRGQSTDLSESGVFVKAEDFFAVGTCVNGVLTVERQPYPFFGRVTRVAQHAKRGMGIEFVDLSNRERSLLKDLIRAVQERLNNAQVRVLVEDTKYTFPAGAFREDDSIILRSPLPLFSLGQVISIGDSKSPEQYCRGFLTNVEMDIENDTPILNLTVRPQRPMGLDWIPVKESSLTKTSFSFSASGGARHSTLLGHESPKVDSAKAAAPKVIYSKGMAKNQLPGEQNYAAEADFDEDTPLISSIRSKKQNITIKNRLISTSVLASILFFLAGLILFLTFAFMR